MTDLTQTKRKSSVQGMFTRIARRYDRMNKIMTLGQDIRWRREVIRRAAPAPGSYLLDLGAGTGDLSQEALRQAPECIPVAADFTFEMMRVGKARPGGERPSWSAADALNIPFPENTFEAVISGFLMRNVSDVSRCLSEQFRVLQPGGRVVILDTTRPASNLFLPLVNFHLHTVIPTLGQWIAKDREAYHYLPESTEYFLAAEQLCRPAFKGSPFDD